MKDSQLEKLSAFTLSLKHPAMAQFKRRPTTKRQYIHYGLLALSPLLASWLIPFVLMQVFPALRVGSQGALTCLLPIALGFSIAFPFSAAIGFWMMRKQKAEESEQARKPGWPCDYVGISYMNGFGIFDIYDTAWDRGWLSHADGKLVFSGRTSSFCLPLSAIVDVKECRTDLLATMLLPRVAIAWRDPDGVVEHLCLEVRDAQSRKDFKLRNHDLFTRLDRLAHAHSDVRQDLCEVEWPFRSSVAMKALAFDPNNISGEDRAAAMAIAFVLYLVLMVLSFVFYRFFHRDVTSLVGSLFFVVAFLVYFRVLSIRQQRRAMNSHGKESHE